MSHKVGFFKQYYQNVIVKGRNTGNVASRVTEPGKFGMTGWDGRVAVTEATGPKVTVGGKTYELIGYDKDGAKVYQDVEVLKEQAEAESKQMEESESVSQEDTTLTETEKESVENPLKDDTISTDRFRTTGDPMREVTGAGLESNPREVQQIIKELTNAGVEIRYHDNHMAYSPGLRAGVPGQFIIDKNASYSAWAHEYKHFCDDLADGFPGMRIFMDTETCKQREIDAYNVEIELAKEANRMDIVERLEKLKELEVSRYDRHTEAY